MCFKNLFKRKNNSSKLKGELAMELAKLRNKLKTNTALGEDKGFLENIKALESFIQTADLGNYESIIKNVKNLHLALSTPGVDVTGLKAAFYNTVSEEVIRNQNYSALATMTNMVLLQAEYNRAESRLSELKGEILARGGLSYATPMQKAEWESWTRIKKAMTKSIALAQVENNKDDAVREYNSLADMANRLNPSLKLKHITSALSPAEIREKLIEVNAHMENLQAEDLGESTSDFEGFDDIKTDVVVAPAATTVATAPVAATTVTTATAIPEEATIRALRNASMKIDNAINRIDNEIKEKTAEMATKDALLRELLIQFNEAEGNPALRERLKQQIHMTEASRQILRKGIHLRMAKQNTISKYKSVIDFNIELKSLDKIDVELAGLGISIPELEGLAINTKEGIEQLNKTLEEAIAMEDVASATDIELGYGEALPGLTYSDAEDPTIARLMTELGIKPKA